MSLTSIPSSSLPSSADLESCVAEAIPAIDLGSQAAKLDLSQRAHLVERMDQPCSYEELRACLHDIARVNRLTLAHRPTLSWLGEIVAARPLASEPLRIVDVGCGYGDTLRHIHAWAARRDIAVTLIGIDLNPDAIRAAQEATPSHQQIEWLVGDALGRASTGEVDIVISSLLTHHLVDHDIVRFLQWTEKTARRGWFINDLHRQAVPYHVFRIVARFARWHPFVEHDGPVSIRRSFRAQDWHTLCRVAGIAAHDVSIREYRPARLCVGRIR